MTEVRDPVIKLFGKTISLLPKQRVSVSTKPRKENCERVLDEEEDGQTLPESKLSANPLEKSSSHQTLEELKDSSKSSEAETQSETSISQEKTLKKPDKILPCPRCKSMETKFCYYNNYNVNQPRHFCKKCQRYWTAGGLMRSVPVGSGRRKNKISCASQYRHIIVSDCLQAARANASVLSFGADSQPFCESIAFTPLDNFKLVKISVSGGARREKGENGGNRNPRPSPMRRPGISPPSFGPCGFPPPPYWGCTALPGTWNAPWIPPPPSSTLGNHLGDMPEKKESFYDGDSERGMWIQKRLRLDMNEAAKKSSIWSTLGIKNGKNDSMNAGGGLFKAFHSKMHPEETYLALQANPAALSRSFNFHESVNEC